MTCGTGPGSLKKTNVANLQRHMYKQSLIVAARHRPAPGKTDYSLSGAAFTFDSRNPPPPTPPHTVVSNQSTAHIHM